MPQKKQKERDNSGFPFAARELHMFFLLSTSCTW